MRKVTQTTVNAFMCGEQCSLGNTVSSGDELILHGHIIAKRENGRIFISNCGYETNTTKERLNGILLKMGVSKIYQKDFKWFWKNGEEFPYNKFVLVR